VSIGIGEKCIESLEKLNFENYRFVINAGVCGSVNPELKLLETISPLKVAGGGKFQTAIPLKQVKNFEEELKNAGIKVFGTLETVKNPVFEKEEKNKLFLRGIDFVDMECFYVAKKIPLLIPIKIITDTPLSNTKNEHFAYISKGLDRLKIILGNILPKLC